MFVDFEMETMLANFHMCGIMLVLRAVFNMLVRNASPIGPMCFRCMMFNFSGLCELLFFTLFYCLLDLSCGECDVISLCFSVSESVCHVCSVFDSVCELFGETIRCFGLVAIVLLNVMDVFSGGGGALLDRPSMVFQRICVLCL